MPGCFVLAVRTFAERILTCALCLGTIAALTGPGRDAFAQVRSLPSASPRVSLPVPWLDYSPSSAALRSANVARAGAQPRSTAIRPSSTTQQYTTIDPSAAQLNSHRVALLPKIDAAQQSLESKLTQSGDLTLRSTKLSEALFVISDIWKVNIVVGQDIQGEVDGSFRNAPLNEILDSILLSNGYGYRMVGQSLVVMPLKDLGDLNPMFETATIRLAYADPVQILEGVRLLSSPHGKVQAVGAANSLMVIDFADRVTMIRQFVQELDQAAGKIAGALGTGASDTISVVQFTPQYVSAEALQSSVETVLSAEGKAAVVTPDNYLVVADYPPQLALAGQVIRQLDVPRS